MKVIYFDTETTGLDHKINEMVQFSAIVEIDGKVEEEMNLFIQPTRWDCIEQGALDTTGMTIEQLRTFEEPAAAFSKLQSMFNRYIDKYDREDKFFPAGHNVVFDINFLQAFWKQHGDKYGIGSYQNWHSIDTRIIASWLLYSGQLKGVENVKLGTLCAYFGIPIQAHDSMSDIRATRDLSIKMREFLK